MECMVSLCINRAVLLNKAFLLFLQYCLSPVPVSFSAQEWHCQKIFLAIHLWRSPPSSGTSALAIYLRACQENLHPTVTFQACLHPRWRSTQALTRNWCQKLIRTRQDSPIREGELEAILLLLAWGHKPQHKPQKVIKTFSTRHIYRKFDGMPASLPWMSGFSGLPASQILLVKIKSILCPFLEVFQKDARSRNFRSAQDCQDWSYHYQALEHSLGEWLR